MVLFQTSGRTDTEFIAHIKPYSNEETASQQEGSRKGKKISLTLCEWLFLDMRQCRLDFCRSQTSWGVTDWRRVIFNDEFQFSLSADAQRIGVWNLPGLQSDTAFIVERHTAIAQGMTVLGATRWDTRSPLVVLQRTLTARSYVNEILTPVVLSMLSGRPSAIYQQDNVLVHLLRDSPNNVFKDMTYSLGHQASR
ncbi:HTH_Tnp_Tc3_2 domain-containing protein [Trichonephila clavipes]|nr:HTH_Tnp_Tc3_2 domain-containing protein [Trichonephila clavipes]